jgi:hypothetical protein
MAVAGNVNRLDRELYRRGTHRLLGNPFLGSLAAFLTVLLLIRVAANLYMAIYIAGRNPNLDAVQVASAHLVFLSAYAVWVGVPAGFRISLSLPRLCFVDFALHGRRFREKFMRRTAFRRPMSLAALAVMLLTMAVCAGISGSWRAVAARGLPVLAVTVAGIIIVTSVASRLSLRRPDLQIMEILYLLLLLDLNPDIGSFSGRVGIFFRGNFLSFSRVWTAGAVAILLIAFALLILLLVRACSVLSTLFRRRLSLSPLERWYWRFLRIRSWVFLYLVITPVFVSSAISSGVKRRTLILALLYGAASYLYFLSHCENALQEKWRCSLLDKGNIRLLTRSVLAHAALMLIPVLGYTLFV